MPLPNYIKSIFRNNGTNDGYDIFSGQLLNYETQIDRIFKNTPPKQAAAHQGQPPTIADIPNSNYFLCFTNRSGSTLLSQALIRTKKMGRPGEMFNPEPIANVTQKYNLASMAEYITWQKQEAMKNGGVFGAKIGIHQLAYLAKHDFLSGYFQQPKFVYITRKDTVLQAISLYIASKTGAWTSNGNNNKNQAIEYNHQAILQRLRSITITQAEFEFFFATHGIMPLRICYEDIEADLEQTMRSVCAWVGIEQASLIELPEIGLKKQRTEMNYDWAEQFRNTYRKHH